MKQKSRFPCSYVIIADKCSISREGDSMRPYIHKVQYYETDKMGITHHSNYIRWAEEARIDYMEQMDIAYDMLEKMGVSVPVIGVAFDYRKSTTFNDIVRIEPRISEYNGIRVNLTYTMIDDRTGDTVAEGKTRHCFMNGKGSPLSLKKNFTELDDIISKYSPEKQK